jgi:hypothetical protein
MGAKSSLCGVLLVRGARGGQPCNRPLKNGRCSNHPNEEVVPMPAAEPAEAELTLEASADAVAVVLAAVDAATEADRPLLIVALRKAILARARAIAHEGLATKPRAVLQQQVNDAMYAAGQLALAEMDVELQTLTAERSAKKGQYMQAEMQYWSPFVFAK